MHLLFAQWDPHDGVGSLAVRGDRDTMDPSVAAAVPEVPWKSVLHVHQAGVVAGAPSQTPSRTSSCLSGATGTTTTVQQNKGHQKMMQRGDASAAEDVLLTHWLRTLTV